MAQWKQYSGVWTRQAQSQAQGGKTWPGAYVGNALFSFGTSQYGPLGIGIGDNSSASVSRSSPTQIGTEYNWLVVSGGFYSFAAIKQDGSLWTWGRNNYGQLGLDYPATNYTFVNAPNRVGNQSNWQTVSANALSVQALKTNGTLWSWGYNSGMVGDGTTVFRSSPVQIGALTNWAVLGTAMAIKTDGTLWSWGNNVYGEVGDGTITQKLSPVQIGSGTNWLTLSLQTQYTYRAAIKTDGTLWAWGRNQYGQLAQNNVVNRSSPVQIGNLTDWKSISGSRAIKTDGTLWSWGYNTNGQAGLGDTANRSSPVQVGVLTNWATVSAALYHTIATKTDGTMWTFGYNGNGQLGTNNTIDYSSPVQIGAGYFWGKAGVSNYYSSVAVNNYYIPSS